MKTLLAFLQLCRFAAVFTAVADIFLGYLLTHPDLSPPGEFALLIGASCGLYLAGMVFNDVFDRADDAAARPERPIPSGRVSVRAAVVFGSILLATGLGCAAAVGRNSAVIAAAIAGCVFLYDGLLKRTSLGPIGMGACRFLNVLLGASAQGEGESGVLDLKSLFAMPQLHVALALGTYITGVTWFARREERTSSRWHLAGGTAVVNLGLMLLAAFVLHWPDPRAIPRAWNAALLLGAIGVVLNRRLMKAIADPAPGKVQLAVRTLLMSLVMLDASIVFFINDDRTFAFAIALLILPAQMFARFLAVT
jgi:4-hydroxybenzoate polyprenyltransferase